LYYTRGEAAKKCVVSKFHPKYCMIPFKLARVTSLHIIMTYVNEWRHYSSSFLLIPPHSSSSFPLTPPHSSSLHHTPPHSTTLLLTPPHSSWFRPCDVMHIIMTWIFNDAPPLCCPAPPCKRGLNGTYITNIKKEIFRVDIELYQHGS
jgi:hypothetical protein